MVDTLELNLEKLAESERKQAWQEMAKQVAHEIKNPLTPMRLNIQSFQNCCILITQSVQFSILNIFKLLYFANQYI